MIRQLALITSCLILLSHQCFALSVGAISPQSGLNQPFLAIVPVLNATPEELETLQISLGDNTQFRQAGIPRPFLLALLKFTLVNDDSGRPYVKIHSKQSIKEPFLEFLVDYQWSKGKILQKYTVLLDPVSSDARTIKSGQKAEAIAASSNIASDRVPSEPPPPLEPRIPDSSSVPPKAQTQPAPAQKAETAPAFSGDTYGPTGKTDTLWSIARLTRPDESVSIQQMMLAILHNNPGAFSSPNVGSLKQGQTLKIPTLAEIRQIDRGTAMKEIKTQYEKNR